jgi:hypothetical protein
MPRYLSTKTLSRCLRLPLAVLAAAALPACTLSRADGLARQSDRVESGLLKERTRVTSLNSSDPARTERLGHLSSLRTQLTLADLARKGAPRLLQGPDVDIAYDVLEEVYSTIEWNIPLGPGEPLRPLPSEFGPAGLRFEMLRPQPR